MPNTSLFLFFLCSTNSDKLLHVDFGQGVWGDVVFFYDFAVYFDKLYWPAGCHKLMPKRAGVFFYDSQGLLA
jgi:hypothetical protein